MTKKKVGMVGKTIVGFIITVIGTLFVLFMYDWLKSFFPSSLVGMFITGFLLVIIAIVFGTRTVKKKLKLR